MQSKQDVQIYDLCPFPFLSLSFQIKFSWGMILICIADCLQPCNVVDYKYSLHGLPVDSDEYFRVLYEVSFNLLSFCAIAIFFNNDFYLVTKKVQQQNTYSFRFLFSLVGIWASSLYSCLGFISPPPPPPPPKKRILFGCCKKSSSNQNLK